eukprot:2222029-Rhodomonas_salina.1
MLRKARAKFGYWPDYVRSDNAPEYDSPKVNAIISENHIELQWSNPHQQEQNAAAETIVNMIGRGVRVLLLQSGLSPEFWGLAAIHVVT